MIANLELLGDAPFLILQLLLDGLMVGAIFAVAAYGMALVWGVMNVINVVQGELVMLGGFIAYQLTLWGVSPLWGIPVAAIVLFFIGTALYYVVIRRVADRDMFISLLATFGLSILLQQLMNQIWGGDVRTAALRARHVVSARLHGDRLADEDRGLRRRHRHRRRADPLPQEEQDRPGDPCDRAEPAAARIMGIDTNRVFAATYGINAALCGAAGALVVMAYSVHPYIGLPYTVRSFMIVIVAGLGNLPGVIAAGLGLGAAENFAGFILGVQYQVAFVFILLVVILVVRSTLLQRRRQFLK